MKRTALARRSPLQRRTALRSRPKPRRDEPGRADWKTPRAGYCSCGCHRFSMHLENHHVVALFHVRQEGRDDLAWDPRNRMPLDPFCHARHTSGLHRLSLKSVPTPALEFARELLGIDRTALYMARYYQEDAA